MSENEIRVLYVQPGKYPEERIIPNTLKASQELVGGNIECCCPWRDSVCIVCNDSGKIDKLPPNRLYGHTDFLAGSFFVCGSRRGDFVSLTTMEYDYEDGHTWASYWPEVLAVFAVQNNLNNDGDVIVIDEGKKRLIQDTFWKMHEIRAEVEEVTATPEPTGDEPDPEPVTEYILHITVSSKSVDALADLYRFTQDQRDILHQLLSEEMRPSLLALCGGIAVADGELCWPLPGHTYISCHFGEVDAFGNAGHRGTDIPAPEGTPILAAHSGTVLVSGWNDSYGNQVLLDNGAGLSTRYAHMTQIAVTAGEAVTAGQVIGYVGSTGDSTGNHLHFEVMQNGVRVNPMDMVCLQEKKQ